MNSASEGNGPGSVVAARRKFCTTGCDQRTHIQSLKGQFMELLVVCSHIWMYEKELHRFLGFMKLTGMSKQNLR